MRTHPVFLRLAGRRCVVIGGDEAAAAKANACAEAGGEVAVVAPMLETELAGLAASGRVRHHARDYRRGDLHGAFLAYASTRDPDLVARLAAEAAEERVLLNVVDMPEACSFLAAAVLARGDLQIAVGTGGASPGLAAQLRRDLEGVVGPEYGPYVSILGAVRRRLAGHPDRRAIVSRLVASPLLELVRAGRRDEVDALLADVAGVECTLGRLGLTLEETAS